MKEEFYTPQEVADLLKIKKNTVYELIKRGDLRCSKIGKQFRIRKDELGEYINRSGGKEASAEAVAESEKADSNQSPDVNTNSILEQNTARKKEINTDIFAKVSTRSPAKELVMCGQDILLEVLCNYLSAELAELPIYRSYQGSYNGLFSLYQDKVDVATVHLWDGETGEYNKDYVKRMLPGTKYIRVHLVKRRQGFYVKEGNPKGIQDFHSLTREDVRFINREKGSGTRILLDEQLIKSGISKSTIKGYEKELNSHLACAGAVARGSADVSMGIERISKEMKGIDFVPIQLESYDLVVKEEAEETDWFRKLIEIINSPNFREEVMRMSGYDITDMGEILE